MPRPGPRPYECVRRAWHSDRHHPIRGSLIQEIFRIVNEAHSSTTKKNREWQEKLPIVVLKAEEIIYCKANSEVEYSDLQTLWDRVNDAINTIIRRDETTETGELLQPCIEAALHLGCTPQRSSRSQRNDAPRFYLRQEKLEGTSVLESNSNTETINPLILQCPQYSSFDPINLFKEQDRVKKILVLPKNFAPIDNRHPPAQTSASPNLWSVYPLYYNGQARLDDPKFHSPKPSHSNSRLMEKDKTGLHQNITSSGVDSLDAICPTNHDRTLDKERGIECDLTLRLGSVVVPCASIENGNKSTLEGRKFKSHLNR